VDGEGIVIVAALKNADAVAWVCLIVGLLVLLAGVGGGLWTSLSKTPAAAKDKVDEAKASIAEAKSMIEETRNHIASTRAGVERSAGGDRAAATSSAAQATSSADAAQSALEQVEGIVGALPENLRFAGLLVLIGTVLMSVATIQFGGVSLF
jgi:flagellar basal body-associated protein FliL